MAEALVRLHAGDAIVAYSAGTAPAGVNPLTLAVLKEIGAPTEGRRSKGVKEFLGRLRVSFLVVVCSEADAACPTIWPGVGQRLFWPFEDPAAAEGSEAERLAKFREVRDKIDARIVEWLGELRAGGVIETAGVA
jgi:arsenate reductase